MAWIALEISAQKRSAETGTTTEACTTTKAGTTETGTA